MSSRRRFQAGRHDSLVGRAAYTLRRILIGPALRSNAIGEERLGRFMPLGVRSPDGNRHHHRPASPAP